jgi:hypothetical protein
MSTNSVRTILKVANMKLLILYIFAVGIEEYIDTISIPTALTFHVSLQFRNWSVWWVLCQWFQTSIQNQGKLQLEGQCGGS